MSLRMKRDGVDRTFAVNPANINTWTGRGKEDAD